MSRLDFGGLKDLWYRIGDVFARRTEAIGALALSGTSLVMSTVSGAVLSTIDLGSVFATDSEAGHSLSISDRTIALKSVSGATLSSVTVPSQSMSGLFASASISLSGNTFTITFYDINGQYADSVSFTIS